MIPGRGCGTCEYCHAGREMICPSFRVLGNGRQGGYAEFVVVEEGDCLPVGSPPSLVEWAAVPLVFQTAWHMLFDRGGLRPGQDVLVEAAGSGVGTAAIQVAKLAGARVVATAGGAAKRDRLAAMGVDLALDSRADDVRKRVKEWSGGRGVDLVFSHVGGDTFTESMACLARGGRLVTCGATAGPRVEIDLRFVFTRELTLSGAYLGTRSDLDAVVRLISQGRLTPVVDRVYPLADFQEAHRRMADRDLFGKLVLTPRRPSRGERGGEIRRRARSPTDRGPSSGLRTHRAPGSDYSSSTRKTLWQAVQLALTVAWAFLACAWVTPSFARDLGELFGGLGHVVHQLGPRLVRLLLLLRRLLEHAGFLGELDELLGALGHDLLRLLERDRGADALGDGQVLGVDLLHELVQRRIFVLGHREAGGQRGHRRHRQSEDRPLSQHDSSSRGR